MSLGMGAEGSTNQMATALMKNGYHVSQNTFTERFCKPASRLPIF